MNQLMAWMLRLREAKLRWILYAVTAAVLAVLCIFPRPYTSRVKVLPGDSGTNALASMVGALGGGQGAGLASLFGDRGATEVSLQLARSAEVTDAVIAKLKLVGPDQRYSTQRKARLDLIEKVDVHSLVGGIIEIETKDHDEAFSLAVTQAYVAALSNRLSTHAQNQVGRKKRIVEGRIGQAQARLDRAQTALNAFRREKQLADPVAQLGSQISLRTGLEAQVQAKAVELATLREIAGPENPRLRVAEQQLATLRAQLAKTAVPTTSAGGPSMGELTGISLRYATLYRDYMFAQAIYDVYSRSAEEVAVQEMVSEDRAQVAIIDPPHVDAERGYNIWAVASLALVLLMALFTEIYAPLTGLWGHVRGSAGRLDEA